MQKLLGHSSIQTTGDIYADWDIDQLAAMTDVLAADEAELPALPQHPPPTICKRRSSPPSTAPNDGA